MEMKSFLNKNKQEVHYLHWPINSPKAKLVISHGMAEHPIRYNHLASFLNSNNIEVYAIYHIGHGEFANKLGHMGKGDFDQCVTNIYELIEKVKDDKKVFLLGHSMGSFISQLFVTRYHNIDALILSGSTVRNAIAPMGAFVSSLICAFSNDDSKPSKFLDNMAFGSYAKAYENPRTKFDWLTKDESIVDEYIKDDYCGWIGSQRFFNNLTSGMNEMGKKKNIKNVDIDLPILIYGGKDDPVSSFGKGLNGLYNQYKNLGVKDVSLIIYENDRHEIFNELDKEKVFEDTLKFIDTHL